MIEVNGFCDDKFSAVRDAFIENFADKDEVGASMALTVEGEFVVDLWAGHKDVARTEFWQEDTIVNVYSTTKTMAALCAHVLADRGELDFHAPVSKYWPEFAQNGKENVEVRHFLSHSAGLSGMDETMSAEDFYDWDKVVEALARQAPWWEPGTASGYHALTQGHLIGEVVRRITGKSIGAFFQSDIAQPLNADFHIGIGEEHFERIGDLIPPKENLATQTGGDKNSIAARTFMNPAISARESKTTGWRKAEIPAANGHGNARSVVRAQTAMANGGSAFGVDLLSAESAARVFEEQTNGKDLVLGVPIRFGLGYGLNGDIIPMGPNEHIAYWGGWGGSTIVIDQDAHLCMSYVMNNMFAGLLGDTRGFGLLQKAYGSL